MVAPTVSLVGMITNQFKILSAVSHILLGIVPRCSIIALFAYQISLKLVQEGCLCMHLLFGVKKNNMKKI